MTDEATLVRETRAALGDIVDRTPLAPEWEDLGIATLERTRMRRSTRGLLIATVAATVVLVAIGGVALLALNMGGEPTVQPTAPTISAPTASTQPTNTTMPTETSQPSVSSTAVTPIPDIVDVTGRVVAVGASSTLDGFPAANLVDGSLQTAWNDDSRQGQGALLTFEFTEPLFLEEVVIENLQDEARLLRHYRVREVEVEVQTADGVLLVSTSASPGTVEPYRIPIGVVHRGTVTIRVLSVWPAEFADDLPPFNELSIAEVRFMGGDPLPGDLQDELEMVRLRALAQVALIEMEIAGVEEAIATASDEVLEELQARLDALREVHDQERRRIERIESLLGG